MSKGGARPGAGRKPLPPDKKRVPICFSVTPETKRRMQILRAQGEKVSALFEHIIGVVWERKSAGIWNKDKI